MVFVNCNSTRLLIPNSILSDQVFWFVQKNPKEPVLLSKNSIHTFILVYFHTFILSCFGVWRYLGINCRHTSLDLPT